MDNPFHDDVNTSNLLQEELENGDQDSDEPEETSDYLAERAKLLLRRRCQLLTRLELVRQQNNDREDIATDPPPSPSQLLDTSIYDLSATAESLQCISDEIPPIDQDNAPRADPNDLSRLIELAYSHFCDQNDMGPWFWYDPTDPDRTLTIILTKLNGTHIMPSAPSLQLADIPPAIIGRFIQSSFYALRNTITLHGGNLTVQDRQALLQLITNTNDPITAAIVAHAQADAVLPPASQVVQGLLTAARSWSRRHRRERLVGYPLTIAIESATGERIVWDLSPKVSTDPHKPIMPEAPLLPTGLMTNDVSLGVFTSFQNSHIQDSFDEVVDSRHNHYLSSQFKNLANSVLISVVLSSLADGELPAVTRTFGAQTRIAYERYMGLVDWIYQIRTFELRHATPVEQGYHMISGADTQDMVAWPRNNASSQPLQSHLPQPQPSPQSVLPCVNWRTFMMARATLASEFRDFLVDKSKHDSYFEPR